MSYTDSDPVEGTLTLTGLWIHDPLDPENTARQYTYGKAARQASIDVDQQPLSFAGRQFPVMYYGDPQTDQLAVNVDIPSDENDSLAELADFAQARRTLCVRDNRGRKLFSSLSGYKEDDQDFGTRVSFEVTRVDFDEEVEP